MFGSSPNMIGTIDGGSDPHGQFLGDAVVASGVFKTRNVGTKHGIMPEGDAAFGCQYLDFKASDGNSIYAGSMLQPKALSALPCIRC